MTDIETLGVRVTPDPVAGAMPYAVVGGRSNARWWLIPLESGLVTASGLAMFQPLLTSARAMKAAASLLSVFGMSRLWAQNIVFITGAPNLASDFPGDHRLSFAYFTGTDSPHRKVAVQIMDYLGRIKGFAKLTRNSEVRKLLAYEAAMLNHVHTLALQTAYVPKVLFTGDRNGGTLLVTDTLKTPYTRSTTKFSIAHRAFLKELAQKTTNKQLLSISEIATDFRARFNRISEKLDNAWNQRLNKAISTLEAQVDLKIPVSLSHGDFTPWNTFMANGRLYVFDWEYSDQMSPISNDLIHFLINAPKTRNRHPSDKLKISIESLSWSWLNIHQNAAHSLITIYLLTLSLRQIERVGIDLIQNQEWDGAFDTAEMFDAHLQLFPQYR